MLVDNETWKTERIGIAITACCVVMVLLNRIHRYLPCLKCWAKDTESGEVVHRTLRYVPDGIERIKTRTKFSKEELKSLYRNFKNECPNGVINEDDLKQIYRQFFPGGDSDMYARFVFNAFDEEENGYINFEEFAIGLSSLSRGSDDDKLNWTFRLYDINRDGYISRNEVLEIIKSVHKLLGKHLDPTIEEDTFEEHTNRVFQKLDAGGNGRITQEKFCRSCKNDYARCLKIGG